MIRLLRIIALLFILAFLGVQETGISGADNSEFSFSNIQDDNPTYEISFEYPPFKSYNESRKITVKGKLKIRYRERYCRHQLLPVMKGKPDVPEICGFLNQYVSTLKCGVSPFSFKLRGPPLA
ncbi:MAG: hypothetical protein K0Q79_812 [Flavipsychrobacter sp.]|jgi:hypothetical protein|nr:hypothetical protein [Flavipsychrobacter sp.]